MAYNLFVSYDLMAPNKNYEAVIKAIKELGAWAHVHKSLWYVHTAHDRVAAFNHIKAAIDTDDKLMVITASNCIWNTLDPAVEQQVKSQWNLP
jgi:hypothetical protein